MSPVSPEVSELLAVGVLRVLAAGLLFVIAIWLMGRKSRTLQNLGALLLIAFAGIVTLFVVANRS